MKKSSPISLFSFQDIITCLTGIMVVIVLMILLQLVDAMNRVTADSPLRDEVKRLEAKERMLKKERDALQNSGSEELEAPLAQYANMTTEKLEQLYAATVLAIKNLQKIEQEHRAAAEKMLQASVDKSNKLTRLRNDLKALTAQERDIMAAFARLSNLRKRREQMKDSVKTKRKALRIEFGGEITGIPVVIECNYWGFRLRKHPDGRIEQIGNPSSGSLEDNISKLISRLKSSDMGNCYPVFLFKEETLRFSNELKIAVSKAGFTNGSGYELIADGEEVFLK